MTVALGDLVAGKYRLLELLGTGGWGTVYAGENVRTLHKVAIKVLHPEMAARREMIQRFEREAQAAGKIGSDHIIEVFDLGELPDGSQYMVMELLDGEDLAARFRRVGPMDPILLAPLVAQVLDGLAAAHDAGILHRDLKPENLFLVRTRTGDDFVKILDFGISKFREAPKSMTVSGAVMGSPSYMSPEQARGKKDIDVRSDVYSIGVVLYEGVTGAVPFEGENFNELLFKIALAETPPDPCARRPELDPEFGAIIRKTLESDPAKRWQTATELRTAVAEWMETKGLTRVEAALIRRARATPTSSPAVRIATGDGAQGNAETIAIPSSPQLEALALPRSHSAEVLVVSAPPKPIVHARSRQRLIAFAAAVVGLGVAALTLNLTRGKDAAVETQVDPPARPSELVVTVPPVPVSASVAAPLTAPVPEPVASKPAVVASAKPVVRPSAPPSASPSASIKPAASTTSSAKAVSTVEGRQIRTGL